MRMFVRVFVRRRSEGRDLVQRRHSFPKPLRRIRAATCAFLGIVCRRHKRRKRLTGRKS